MGTDPDRLDALIRTRRSVRRFAARAVPGDVLDEVLEAARWAPTAGNRQAFRLWVVTAGETIRAMADAVAERAQAIRQAGRPDLSETLDAYLDNFTFFRHAPCVVVPIHRLGPDLLAASTGQDARPAAGRQAVDSISSVAAATMLLLLAAHARGLGGCWMTGPLVAAERLEALLAVPRGWSIAALVPLGYPDEAPAPPGRRDLDRLVKRLG